MFTVKRRREGRAPALCALFYALLLVGGCGGADAEGSGSRTQNQNMGGGFGGAGGRPGTGGSGGGGLAGIDMPDPPMDFGGMGGAPAACAEVTVRASRILPTVMLVVDGSTSMEMPYGEPVAADPDAGTPAIDPPSRWSSVREALVGPEGVVPSLQGLVHFGLAVFGTMPSCPLPTGVIAPALNNAAAITPAVPAAPPGFTTPTGLALEEIVKMLPDPTMVLDSTPIGPQIILLATDGDPNSCEGGGFLGVPVTDYVPSINAALAAQAKHLKMYVVSVGQDAAAAHLQEMANIGANVDRMTGGAPVYYPEDTASLKSTLETLIGAELSCDLALEGQGVKMGQECTGTVKFNGMDLECNGADGFELKDPKTLTIKGATCDIYKNSVDSSVSATFPCEAIIPG